MKEKSQHLCAFCSSQLRLPRQKRIGVVSLLWAALASLSLTLLIFQNLDPRGLLLFVLLLGGTEMFLILRWRIRMICRRCGFDPVVYVKSPEKACQKVREHYELHKQSEKAAFVPHPIDQMLKERAAHKRRFEEKFI